MGQWEVKQGTNYGLKLHILGSKLINTYCGTSHDEKVTCVTVVGLFGIEKDIA